VVRTVGEYRSVEDIENIVISHRDGAPIFLRDVAYAELTFRKIDAMASRLNQRILPIFLTVGTSSLAVLPLVLAPGAGAEVYRGLGAVVIGGLLVSTLFTLFLVPALLSLVMAARRSF